MSAPAIPPALNRGVHGWDAARLSDAYTADELAEAITQLHADPRNANPQHAAGKSIYLYTPKTQQRSAALAMAIYHIKQARRRDAA